MNSTLAQFQPETMPSVPIVITTASIVLAIIGAAVFNKVVIRVPLSLGFALIHRCFAYLNGDTSRRGSSGVFSSKSAGNPTGGPGGGGTGGTLPGGGGGGGLGGGTVGGGASAGGG